MADVITAPISAPATPRPTRSSNSSTSSGAVSQSVCVRSPTARPASNAPSTIMRPDRTINSAVIRRSPSAPGVCHHHAVARHACAASAKARPGRSLIGRALSVQTSGLATVSTAAPNATGSSAVQGGGSSRAGRTAANTRYKRKTETSAATRESSARARASTCEAGPAADRRATTGAASLPRAT